jgi:hypothetical protein
VANRGKGDLKVRAGEIDFLFQSEGFYIDYKHDKPALVAVYAGKVFTKNRLQKAQPEIQEALQTVGVASAELQILAESKPASDSQTAAVLDMMGGGEEVNL